MSDILSSWVKFGEFHLREMTSGDVWISDDAPPPEVTLESVTVTFDALISSTGLYSTGIRVLVDSDTTDSQFTVKMTRGGDEVGGMPDRFQSIGNLIVPALRAHVYERMNKWIKWIHPSSASEYFFGDVELWTPEGKNRLIDYIIHLNDSTDMSREEIAQHIEDLMGSAVPRIPVNPMSWILEDRPVEFVDKPHYMWAHGPDSKVITAGKITADKITVSSLHFNEIPTPAKVYAKVEVEDLSIKEDSDGKEWLEVGYVLPSDIGITGPVHLGVDKPPEV